MARIYQTRQLLDPQLITNMNNVAQQRYANEVARRKPVMDSLNTMFSSVGKTIDEAANDYYERKARQEMVKNLNHPDPNVNAALNAWANNPKNSLDIPKILINSYDLEQQRKMHDAIRQSEDKTRAQEAYGIAEPQYRATKATFLNELAKQNGNINLVNPQIIQDYEIATNKLNALNKRLGYPEVPLYPNQRQETPRPQVSLTPGARNNMRMVEEDERQLADLEANARNPELENAQTVQPVQTEPTNPIANMKQEDIYNRVNEIIKNPTPENEKEFESLIPFISNEADKQNFITQMTLKKQEPLFSRLNTLLDNKNEWTDAALAEANDIAGQISDDTTRKNYETKIQTRGKTKERKAREWAKQKQDMKKFILDARANGIQIPDTMENYNDFIPKAYRKYIKIYPAYGGWKIEPIGDWMGE
jgi:hypothetical protein